MNSKLLPSIIAVLIGITVTVAANANSVTFKGDVHSLDSNKHLYSEQHVIDQKRLTTDYTSPDGASIAKRELRFENGRVASYELHQLRHDKTESVMRHGDTIKITTSDEGTTEITPANIDDIVIDAGFTNFILRNWDALTSGKTVTADLLSVARKEPIKLKLEAIDPATSAMAKHGSTEGVSVFRMKISNPFLRFLVDPIDVGYYNDTKQMAFYQGLSNLLDEDGKQIDKIWVLFKPQISSTMPLAD